MPHHPLVSDHQAGFASPVSSVHRGDPAALVLVFEADVGPVTEDPLMMVLDWESHLYLGHFHCSLVNSRRLKVCLLGRPADC